MRPLALQEFMCSRTLLEIMPIKEVDKGHECRMPPILVALVMKWITQYRYIFPGSHQSRTEGPSMRNNSCTRESSLKDNSPLKCPGTPILFNTYCNNSSSVFPAECIFDIQRQCRTSPPRIYRGIGVPKPTLWAAYVDSQQVVTFIYLFVNEQ